MFLRGESRGTIERRVRDGARQADFTFSLIVIIVGEVEQEAVG